MKRYRSAPVSQYVFVGLLLLLTVGLAFLNQFLMRQIAFEDHFVLPWSAARTWLLQGDSPYQDSVVVSANDTLRASSFKGTLPNQQNYQGLIFDLIFYIPFSLIPYGISRVIWVTLIQILSGGIVYLALTLAGIKWHLLEKWLTILLLTLWMPGVLTSFSGSLSPVVIFCLFFGFFQILRRQDRAAGFLLALSASSFFSSTLILLLILIWSISKKRWTIVLSYASGVAFMWVMSLLLQRSWPLAWLGVMLKAYDSWGWINTPLMEISRLLPGIAGPLSIFLHGGFGLLLLVSWITLLGKSGRVFIWKALLLFVLAFLFHPQASLLQVSLLLPALFLVFRFWTERWRLDGRILSWGVIGLFFISSWYFAFPLDSLTDVSQHRFYWVGLPFLTLLALIYVRWWALRIPELPFEKSLDMD